MSDNEYFVAKLHECKACSGTGRAYLSYDDIFRRMDRHMPCLVCHGAGKMPEWILLVDVLGEYWVKDETE